MKFKENLRYLRKVNGLSQEELAHKLGYKSFTTVQKWEDGTSFPKLRNLNLLADLFNVEIDHLLNQNLIPDHAKVPIVGVVKAGYDLYADEDILGYEYCSNQEYEPGENYYLRVKGDSMEGFRIKEGDLVYVHRQSSLENREIGVFLLENNEVTIKQMIKKEGKVVLKAANEKYEDREYQEEDVRILGKVLHAKVMF